MKILVDENIPGITVQELRRKGHDVLDIRGTEKEGLPDEDLWKLAQRQERLLITTDKGFTRKRHEKHQGILIVRLKQPNKLKIHQKVMRAMGLFTKKDWAGLTIVMRDAFHTVWRTKKPAQPRRKL